MSLFKKRPQLQAVEYVSPPHADTLHAFHDEYLPTEERVAKIRRIEEYARDVLKSRNVFIASAGLRGPFENGWKNPWKTKVPEVEEEVVKVPVEAAVEPETQQEELPGPFIPDTEARPVSRVGSDYCYDWLKRQDVVKEYSPDVGEADAEMLQADEAEKTPSKPSLKDYFRKQKTVRLDVVPAWTADQPERRSMMSDMPMPTAKLDSLAVEMHSSVAKRSLSEQPAKRNYKEAFRKQVDEIETSIVKTSMVPKHVPRKGSAVLTRKRQKLEMVPADSPGFVFRRVGDGKRPISRDSNQSKGSTTQRDVPSIEEQVWVSIKKPTAPRPAVQPEPQSFVAENEVMQDEVLNIPEDNDDGEIVHISANEQGKWPCPMVDCAKSLQPYASASNARKHLKTKHGFSAHRIITNHSRAGTRSKTRSLEPALQLTTSRNVMAEHMQAAEEHTREAPRQEKPIDPVISRSEPAVATEMPMATGETIKPLPVERAYSPSTLVPTAPAPTAVMHIPATSENARENTIENDSVDDVTMIEAEADHDSVLGPDEETTSKTSEQTSEPVISAEAEAAAKSATSTSEPQPDRQDSRAYTTFTFNTQAALLQAHQAFQDTQSLEKSSLSPEKAHQNPPSPEAEAPTTPFRRPGIPSFFNHASLTRAVPVSTQDLMNAAADLSFSTVKKPTQATATATTKKRISFADWNQAKPLLKNTSQPASLKPVEWSPYVDTPSTTIFPPHKRESISHSQPETETPIRSVLTKKKKELSASFTYTPFLGTGISGSGSSEQFAQVPKSSGLLPSYQANTRLGEDRDRDRDRDLDLDREIEDVLDGLDSFLEEGDVDRLVRRNAGGVVVRGG